MMKFAEVLSRRSIKALIFTYAFISIIYTANRFYMTVTSQLRTARRSIIESKDINGPFFAAPLDLSIIEDREEEELRKMIYFDNDNNDDRDDSYVVTDLKATTQVTTDPVFQSKLYSGAMGKIELLPYFSKATKKFHNEDITISTIVTSDRFPVLSRLATRYKGPISAVVHINDNENKADDLDMLFQTLANNQDMRRYVDIHLIIDRYDRQFNMWRNTAKLYARTDYIMMLDIDFYLCTDFRKSIAQNPSLMNMLRDGRTALVVPAFEYLLQTDGAHHANFPTDKDELMQQVFDTAKLDMFHVAWENGHSATNYGKWYLADQVYKVEDYNFSYEPYVIFKKETSPWCDERFIGYGANKAACLYEIYLSGIDYFVLPNDFLIHQSHPYPETTRRMERIFNKKLYTNFREELCLRYARQFVANGEWNTSRSENLKNECQKIRGFRKLIETIDN